MVWQVWQLDIRMVHLLPSHPIVTLYGMCLHHHRPTYLQYICEKVDGIRGVKVDFSFAILLSLTLAGLQLSFCLNHLVSAGGSINYQIFVTRGRGWCVVCRPEQWCEDIVVGWPD